MTATSIGRIVVSSLALVATGAAALVFGITHVWREPPAETKALIAAAAVSPAASSVRDEGSAAATAQAEAADHHVVDHAPPQRRHLVSHGKLPSTELHERAILTDRTTASRYPMGRESNLVRRIGNGSAKPVPAGSLDSENAGVVAQGAPLYTLQHVKYAASIWR
jgi:hypothetical protein